MNSDFPLGLGRALARSVGLKPDLQSVVFVGVASAIEQSWLNQTIRGASSAFDYRNVGWLVKAEQVAMCIKHVAVAGSGNLYALTLLRLYTHEEVMEGDNG